MPTIVEIRPARVLGKPRRPIVTVIEVQVHSRFGSGRRDDVPANCTHGQGSVQGHCGNRPVFVGNCRIK